MEVKRTERGWAGHYICSHLCRFRRNTLIEYGEKRWIVSTVGAMVMDGHPEPVGNSRWYETMAFVAGLAHGYWDADLTKEVPFESPWGIFADSPKELGEDSDTKANNMHEAVVAELMEKIKEDENV